LKTLNQILLEIAKIKRGFPTVKTVSYGFVTNPDVNFSKGEINNSAAAAVKLYTKSSSGINGQLRRGQPHFSREHEEADKALSDHIKSNKTDRDLYVYHSNDHVHELYDAPINKETGAIHIEHKGYTSTSLNHQTAADFTRSQVNPQNYNEYSHVIKIHVPKGSHAAYVSGHATYSDEREILLHKGARLAIHPKPTYDNNQSLTTWHANLIHDGVAPTAHAKAKK